MQIVILGGGGFIGGRLARELLVSGQINNQEIKRLTLIDRAFPNNSIQDPRVKTIVGDFSQTDIIEPVMQQKPDLIFHLAAIVSGEAEKNFDVGMSVNLHASLQLLELCRNQDVHPRIVFASSCAVFGGDVTQTITDTTGPRPLSSYGTQKAMAELLMNDYSRRGFADARSLRLPTIVVRPGKPNAATSSFVSSIIREPLNGKPATFPVPPETEVWIQSPKCVVRNFIHAATLNEKDIAQDRIINLPGITVSIKEMINSLEQLTSSEVTKLISHKPDTFLESIVLTWPPHFETPLASRLGFFRNSSITEIIQQFIKEENIKI